MKICISILDKNKEVKATSCGEDFVALDFRGEYQEGDSITIKSEAPTFIVARPEDSIPPVLGWLSSEYQMTVPFGEKMSGHSPKCFVGDCHILTARLAYPEEISAYRNLAFNPFDCHENSGFFPHASANVETRGEAVFAARNAINGNTANISHGRWPYESWGINRQDDAQIKIDFGRRVTIDQAIITLRADFPHDNWWHEATLEFSDGSKQTISLVKSANPQKIKLDKKTVEWVIMKDMKKDENDESPFPALTQIELWGNEA